MASPRFGTFVALRGGALGDVIATFPALAALRTECRELVFYAPRRVATLARDAGLADRVGDVLGADLLWLHGGGRPPRWDDVDLAVTWVAETAGALEASGVKRVLAGSADGPILPVHRQLLGALAPIGLDGAPIRLRVPWPRIAADPFVALVPGSGGARKRWPLECWRSLEQILGSRGIVTRWIAGPVEAEEAATWPAERTIVEEDLGKTASLAASARVWVGVDAGTSHLAALVGCPTIVLFGPTDPARWAPPGAIVRSLADSAEEIADAVVSALRGR